MQDGDLVTGVPFNERTREKYPTVTGRLESIEYKFGGETHKDQMILVDGISVDVEDGSIVPAARRDKETVF